MAYKTLKQMNLGELVALKNEWADLYSTHGAENFRTNFLEVEAEILTRCNEETPVKDTVINVFYEVGYKWSVDVDGESVDSSLTKKEAMGIARQLKKEIANSVINEQKLTRQERKENLSWLHENSFNFMK